MICLVVIVEIPLLHQLRRVTMCKPFYLVLVFNHHDSSGKCTVLLISVYKGKQLSEVDFFIVFLLGSGASEFELSSNSQSRPVLSHKNIM